MELPEAGMGRRARGGGEPAQEVPRAGKGAPSPLRNQKQARPQEQVLGDLHRDGAGAVQTLARSVVAGRGIDGMPVEAGMLAFLLIIFGLRH
jgi:hypothetical protein